MKKSLVTLFLLTAVFCQSQSPKGTSPVTTCKIDTIRGFIYRVKHGSCSMEMGYYIAKCGRMQISKIAIGSQVKGPIWTQPPFLKNDRIGSKGILINTQFQKQYPVGYFIDDCFKKIPVSSIYQFRALE